MGLGIVDKMIILKKQLIKKLIESSAFCCTGYFKGKKIRKK